MSAANFYASPAPPDVGDGRLATAAGTALKMDADMRRMQKVMAKEARDRREQAEYDS